MSLAPSLRRTVGLRTRVVLIFTLASLVLVLSVGLIVWGVSSRSLLDLRQQGALRQAQASAAVVQRLLTPRNPDLPRQAQELAEVNESGVLVTERGSVLASTGLAPEQVPARLRQLVESGVAARQRVRIDGEVRLLVGIPLGEGRTYYQSLPFRRLNSALGALRATLVTAGVSGVVLGGLLGWVATRRALRPIDELTVAARAVAGGELTARMPEDDPDLAQLAATFNATTAALERRVKADARFTSNVSHELRTPLTTMGNAMAVLERRRAQLPEAAREALELLGSQLARLERLVLDLLDISVITEGHRTRSQQHVHLPGLVRQLAATERWGPVVVLDEALDVSVDPRRFERVVSNLVRNAQSHGGGLVQVTLRRHGEHARIEVNDGGPGVPPGHREHVFERFTRGEAESGAKPGGAGLGLAIVAEVTRLHQGRVWVDDRPGGGARFVVELPLARP